MPCDQDTASVIRRRPPLLRLWANTLLHRFAPADGRPARLRHAGHRDHDRLHRPLVRCRGPARLRAVARRPVRGVRRPPRAVLRAGRCPSGHPAVEVLRPPVRALDEALDVVGTPTEGVAVTLTVPLLQLAARARAGALELGALSVEEIGVDEAGAVLVADRPPGAVPPCRDDSASGTTPTESVTVPVGRPTRSPRDADGSRQLVLAARTVWDRVDARTPVREVLDPVLDAAVDGGADDVRAALALVLAAAPPRPVRWTRPLGALFDDGARRRSDGRPGQDARAAAASTAVGTAAGPRSSPSLATSSNGGSRSGAPAGCRSGSRSSGPWWPAGWSPLRSVSADRRGDRTTRCSRPERRTAPVPARDRGRPVWIGPSTQ